MQFQEFQRLYKANKKHKDFLPAGFVQRVDTSLAVQVHSTGARPDFVLNGMRIKPETYDTRYDEVFKYRLLNRHPNENDEHHNWRRSVYAPIGKELFDRFLEMSKGSILQPNNFSISVDDPSGQYVTNEFLRIMAMEALEFYLNNPTGYTAVIESDNLEKDDSTEIKPKMVFIKCEDIIQLDEESVVFKYKKEIIYLNATEQIFVLSGIQTTHNFGLIPFWNTDNAFMQPFVIWAENLVRNMNDDEAMTKHYSYPIKQVVLPACPTCFGTGHKTIEDKDNPLNNKVGMCDSCDGRGTISVNPGDNYTMSEEKLAKNGGQMYDVVKFHTPDVGIPQYHLDRWQVFYERAEKALFLSKKINATESGEAKKEDRKDQYYFLLSLSNFLFNQIEYGLKFITAYINYTTTGYTPQEVYLIRPKQFDLMSDSDLVNEFAAVQGKTDDGMILSEMCFMVNSKVFRDDPVSIRINDVLYYVDPLYGVSGNALRSKLLSGVFTAMDKTIHEKGYMILKNIAYEKGQKAFIEADVNTLITEVTQRAMGMVPTGIYE
jgi:hypothetical protein